MPFFPGAFRCSSHCFLLRSSICLIVFFAGSLQALELTSRADILTEDDSPEIIQILGHKAPRDSQHLSTRDQTGSRLGLKLAEIPSSIEIIDQQQILQRGDRSLLETVQGGVGMSGGKPPGAPTIFSTRGFTASDVTLLYDGIRIANALMSTNPGDSWHLERVEILKGPASVLYGEGAVGGVVNFISKKPSQHERHSELLLAYGSWNQQRIGLGSGGPLRDGLSYRVDISHQSADGFIDRTPYQYQQVSGALTYKLSDDFTMSVETDAIHQNISSYFGTPMIDGLLDIRFFPRNYNVRDDKTKLATQWLRVKLEWEPTDSLRLQNLTYQYTADRHWRNAENYTYQPLSDQILVNDLIEIQHDQELIGNRLTSAFDNEIAGYSNTFLLGLDISQNDFKHTNNAPYSGFILLNPDFPQQWSFAETRQTLTLPKRQTSQKQMAIYFEDKLSLPADLTAVVGARSERNILSSAHLNPNIGIDGIPLQELEEPFEKNFEATSWRLGLVYQPQPGLSAYAVYSNSISSPASLVTLTQAAKDYQLERGEQSEIGLKHELTSFSYTLSTYQIRKKNLLSRDPNDVSQTVQIGHQSSIGVEWAMTAQISNQLHWQANLAFVKAQYDRFLAASDSQVVSYKGNTPPNVPQVVANSWLFYQNRGWSTGLGVRHEGEREGNRENNLTLPAYTLTHASLAKAWLGFDWTLRVRNITNTRYIQWGSWADMALVGEPRSFEAAIYRSF